jgi:hypothetical protein
MTSVENFYSSIDTTGPAIVHLGPQGKIANDIKLKVCGHRLMIVAAGEPPSTLLLEHFREGLAQGVLHPNMRTLVDLTRFVGVVDWSAMSKLRVLAPWGTDPGEPSRTAYLLRESSAVMMVKAVSALFPQSAHKAFTDKAKAISWLEAAQLH